MTSGVTEAGQDSVLVRTPLNWTAWRPLSQAEQFLPARCPPDLAEQFLPHSDPRLFLGRSLRGADLRLVMSRSRRHTDLRLSLGRSLPRADLHEHVGVGQEPNQAARFIISCIPRSDRSCSCSAWPPAPSAWLRTRPPFGPAPPLLAQLWFRHAVSWVSAPLRHE